MAYDFLNKELKIGDKVVYIQTSYRDLRVAKIVKIGKKKATIAVDQTNTNRTTVRFFDQLIKI